VPSQAFAGAQAEKIVAALDISSGTKAYSAGGPGIHGIVMFFVCLNVGTEFQLGMMFVVDTSACHNVSRRKSVGDTICCGETVDPKYSCLHQVNEHDSWDMGERQAVVTAPSAVFDSANKSLDVRNVLVCGTAVQLWESAFQWLKLRVSQDCGDAETACLINGDYVT
jgi:hypothetical protein